MAFQRDKNAAQQLVRAHLDPPTLAESGDQEDPHVDRCHCLA